MSTGLRITLQTRLVLEALLAAPDRELHGYQLLKATGLASGTLYPLLLRLVRTGWLNSRWEDRDEPGGRPRRRFYGLSSDGAERARTLSVERPTGFGRAARACCSGES